MIYKGGVSRAKRTSVVRDGTSTVLRASISSLSSSFSLSLSLEIKKRGGASPSPSLVVSPGSLLRNFIFPFAGAACTFPNRVLGV